MSTLSGACGNTCGSSCSDGSGSEPKQQQQELQLPGWLTPLLWGIGGSILTIAGSLALTENIDILRPHSMVQNVVFQPPAVVKYSQNDPYIHSIDMDTDKRFVYYHIPPPPLYGKRKRQQDHSRTVSTDRVMVYFHGNSEDMIGSTAFLHYMHTCLNSCMNFRNLQRWHVFSVEYCGYGMLKQDTLDEKLTISKVSSFLESLVKEQKLCRWSDLFLLGRSIGTGFVCAIQNHMHQLDIGGTILISPFTRLTHILENACHLSNTALLYPAVSCLLYDRFDNEKHIALIQNPVLILHGTQDTLIPIIHAYKLQNARPAKNTSVIPMEDGTHNDLSIAQLARCIMKWLDSLS